MRLETLFTIETMLKTLCIHCDLNQINIVFSYGKKHCYVDIVACIRCACSSCSAMSYLKIVLLFICLLGHNLIQYSQFHLTKLWRIFLNKYIFIGYFECSLLICCQGLNVRTLFSMYLVPCISIMVSTCSCILCLSFATIFLVCGDVTRCIFSACRHASLKLRGIGTSRMSPSCSISNINRVAKFYETPYLIYKKEQYRSSIYSKMIKYLKTQTLTYLFIWDNTIVGYNNYAHTVISLTPSYIISIVLALEHSRFAEHVPLMKIIYLFDCKQCTLFHHIIICHILYSLGKTMCLVGSRTNTPRTNTPRTNTPRTYTPGHIPAGQ